MPGISATFFCGFRGYILLNTVPCKTSWTIFTAYTARRQIWSLHAQ